MVKVKKHWYLPISPHEWEWSNHGHPACLHSLFLCLAQTHLREKQLIWQHTSSLPRPSDFHADWLYTTPLYEALDQLRATEGARCEGWRGVTLEKCSLCNIARGLCHGTHTHTFQSACVCVTMDLAFWWHLLHSSVKFTIELVFHRPHFTNYTYPPLQARKCFTRCERSLFWP